MTYRPVNRVSRTDRVTGLVSLPGQEHASPVEASPGTDEPQGPAARPRLALAPWLALCGDHAVEMRDPRLEALRSIPPGTTVVLLCDQPLSRWRLRRIARRAGMEIERELIAVPSTSSPVVLLDEDESAVQYFWNDVVTVPPGLALAWLPASVVLRLARALPWRWTGALAPGRVVIGRRT